MRACHMSHLISTTDKLRLPSSTLFIFYIENLCHAEVTLPFLIESTSTVVENMLLANVLGCTWVSFWLQ